MILIAAKLIIGLLFLWLFLWSLVSYLRDLHFYWQNGWNFGEDHPGFDFYREDENEVQHRITNRTRTLWVWPFFVVAFGILTIVYFKR